MHTATGVKILTILLVHSWLALGLDTNSTIIPYCCSEGHIFVYQKSGCEPGNSTARPVFMDDHGQEIGTSYPFSVDLGFVNCSNSAILMKTSDVEQFHVMLNGSLRMESKILSSLMLIDPQDYCLLFTPNELQAAICFSPDHFKSDASKQFIYKKLYPTLLSISAVFLFLTFVVYCLLQELRDQLGLYIMTLLMHYSFIAAFLWLSVISVHIFRAIVFPASIPNRRSMKSFFLSGLYAWGLSLSLTIFTMMVEIYGPHEGGILPHPQLGLHVCWFSSEEAKRWYFFGPAALILALNTILFVASAGMLFKLKKKGAMFSQFALCLKLLLLMGITWIIEVVPSFFTDANSLSEIKYQWVVLDMVNLLQGVLIFVVFVCRSAVLARLLEISFGPDTSLKWFPRHYSKRSLDEGVVDDETEFRNFPHNQEKAPPGSLPDGHNEKSPASDHKKQDG